MQSNVGPFNLASTFVRLRSDVSIETLPVDDAFWKKMAAGDLRTFHNEYLGKPRKARAFVDGCPPIVHGRGNMTRFKALLAVEAHDCQCQSALSVRTHIDLRRAHAGLRANCVHL